MKASLNIILGVSGSISAYRAYDIVRELTRSGHSVRVLMTRGAEHFVQKEMFNYLGADAVYSAGDDFTNDRKSILHIDLARWCDSFVVAPLSANTLAKLAHAQADDLLTSSFLAIGRDKKAKLFFPAMNTKMLEHPLVQQNLKTLKSLPDSFIHPTESGLLACMETGSGRLAEIETVVELTQTFQISIPVRQQKTFLITAGATLAPLDPVRYLTNSSSGATGVHLAREILSRGHRVIMIAGEKAHKSLDYFRSHPKYDLYRVKTNSQMREQVFAHIDQSDVYISAAAISDIKFSTAGQKIKKSKLQTSIPIAPDRDILKEVLDTKRDKIIIGFAAETQLDNKVLSEKMANKPVDLLIGTKVHNGLTDDTKQAGFGLEHGDYLLYTSQQSEKKSLSKKELAQYIVNYCLAHPKHNTESPQVQ